jgi:cytochrome oxidase Cu insertion factor (SCO1/SenC/PrrC family)
MSDNSSTTNDATKTSSVVARPIGSVTAKTARVLFVANGLVLCVLALAWVAFGSRGQDNLEAPRPFASATDKTDTTDDEEDDDGRPKVIKVELKWPESGVANFEFTERSGKIVHKEDLVGHPWVVSFIFTHCAGPCFKVTSAMRRLQDEFFPDTDLRLVTITVDPERDTPAELAKYATSFEASPERWLFLTDPTGQKDKIYPLINGSFLMPVQEATGAMRIEGHEFIHTNNILLVDERGVVQGKWNSIDDASFDQLRRELRKRYPPKKLDSSKDEGSLKSE